MRKKLIFVTSYPSKHFYFLEFDCVSTCNADKYCQLFRGCSDEECIKCCDCLQKFHHECAFAYGVKTIKQKGWACGCKTDFLVVRLDISIILFSTQRGEDLDLKQNMFIIHTILQLALFSSQFFGIMVEAAEDANYFCKCICAKNMFLIGIDFDCIYYRYKSWGLVRQLYTVFHSQIKLYFKCRMYIIVYLNFVILNPFSLHSHSGLSSNTKYSCVQ